MGYIQNSKLTIYLPRWQLNALNNATQVTQYWQDVMDTSDYYYGYDLYRKRGEVMSANRQVAFGAAYAGYPIELGWGADSEVELNNSRLNGEWGSYHELGHGFQDDFNGSFGHRDRRGDRRQHQPRSPLGDHPRSLAVG